MRRCILLLVALAAVHGASQPETLDIKLQDRRLFDLIEQIARQCEAGLLVHQSVAGKLDGKLSLVAARIPWAEMVGYLRDEHGLAVALDGGRLLVGDADAAMRARLVVRRYDIQHLLVGHEHRPAGGLGLADPGSSSRHTPPPIDDAEPPEQGRIVDILRTVVGPPEVWRVGRIDEFEGALIIDQLPEVHEQITAALAWLERIDARQILVRVHQLPAGGPAGPVVDAAGWRAYAGSPVIAAWPAFDGAQSHTLSGVQRWYVADVDVNQNRHDPILSLLADGLCVDVQPAATLAGVAATIRFDATRGQTILAEAVVRDDAGRPLATLGTPTLTLDSVRDTRLVPPGGAAIYRCGDRTLAVTFEIIDPAKAPATK